jgi:CTP synthase (UTP-ammonia lyase)
MKSFDLIHISLIVNSGGMSAPHIGIIGEFNSDSPLHLATTEAIRHSCARHGIQPSIDWLPTAKRHDLGQFDGFWCSPGGPYESLEGALEMIRWARLERKPFIGTCAGFQHAVLEFARNVLGIKDAMHAEYDPNASTLFIRPLTCSLVGKRLAIRLRAGSKAATLYGGTEAIESYYCNFGLNPVYRARLESAGLTISGWDDDDENSAAPAILDVSRHSEAAAEARVIELPDHPFFLGTLFVPQASSTAERPHPLIAGFAERIAVGER